MLFFRKKNSSGSSAGPSVSYDPLSQEPALRCSICNGEQVAGFRDRKTGTFTEVILIRTPADLASFCALYGIHENEIHRIY